MNAELQGFANTEITDLTITIGLELQRDVTLALQGLQETVTVTGLAPVVETTRTEVASVVTQEQIESLPIANRQPISLALLLPGTSMDATVARRSQANIGAGGSANTMNLYHVDGGMNVSNNSGQQHLEVPQSAIREFRVNLSQSSAEYGAVGGVVLTATKSGTNRFSGEVFEFFRDKSLNAIDQLEKDRHDRLGEPKPDYRRHSRGGALGGPIIRDRLHFFAAIERSTEEGTAMSTPTSRSSTRHSKAASHASTAAARGSCAATSRSTRSRTSSSGMSPTWSASCARPAAASTRRSTADLRSPRDSNLVAHTWVIGSRMLNEFRAQIPPSHLNSRQGPPGTTLWPASQKGEFPDERFEGYTQIYQFPSLNWGSNTWSMNWTDRTEIRDDFSITMGAHGLKIGGGYVRLFSPEEQPGNIGTWLFDTDQFFDGTPAAMANLRDPIQFTSSFPPLLRELRNNWIQAYVQDEWRLRSNVTVSLGLRYDNQYKSFNNHLDLTPVPRLRELIDPASRGDHNNFGPRLGVAWDIRDDGESVVRAAYGTYYQYVMQSGLRPELTALRQTSIVIRNPTYPDPYGGRTPASFASTAPPNVNITDDDLENARARSLTVGYSQGLEANLALHVDGIYTNVDTMTQTRQHQHAGHADRGPAAADLGAHPRAAVGRRARVSGDVRCGSTSASPTGISIWSRTRSRSRRTAAREPLRPSPTSTTQASTGDPEAPIGATPSSPAARCCCRSTSMWRPSGRCARRCRSARARAAT